MLEENAQEAITDTDKAEMLARQYVKVHNIELDNNTPEQQDIIKAVENTCPLKNPSNSIKNIRKPPPHQPKSGG